MFSIGSDNGTRYCLCDMETVGCLLGIFHFHRIHLSFALDNGSLYCLADVFHIYGSRHNDELQVVTD